MKFVEQGKIPSNLSVKDWSVTLVDVGNINEPLSEKFLNAVENRLPGANAVILSESTYGQDERTGFPALIVEKEP